MYFARMILGVLTNSFYDDCVIVEPAYCARSGQYCMRRVMELIGMPFSDEKHEEVGPSSPFLGVVSDFSASLSHGVMRMSIKADRRERLLKLLDTYILELRVSRSDAASLEGKLQFCILSQFGRVGRAALSVVREHAHHSTAEQIGYELECAL